MSPWAIGALLDFDTLQPLHPMYAAALAEFEKTWRDEFLWCRKPFKGGHAEWRDYGDWGIWTAWACWRWSDGFVAVVSYGRDAAGAFRRVVP